MIVVPGFCCASAVNRSDASVMGVLPRAVITSPCCTPACAAGPLTLCTSAPESVVVVLLPWLKGSWLCCALAASTAATPR